MRLDDTVTQFGRHGTGAGGDRGRRVQREEARSLHNSRDRLHNGRSVSLEPDHAADNNSPAFIDDIDSVSSFPPLRDDHQSTFVNSFSQFKRWPSHAPDPHPDHPIHKSSSTPADLNEVRISDGEKLAAAANLGFTNSFTKDRILKMGSLGSQSPSPSPSPSTSPPMNPFRSVSNSSSENQGMLKSKSASHVVIGGITCPMVRKLSLLKHRSSSLNEKVRSSIKT
ncbi:hypothetical protein LINPERPRIM_LOCUS3465 [Linum perenne]